MDPSAPNKKNQDGQQPQGNTSPIQPGQFVIASDETLSTQAGAPGQPVQDAIPQQADSYEPAAGVQTNGQSPINLAGFTANTSQDPSLQFQNPLQPPPPPSSQPDPTPFTPPPPIPPPGASEQQTPAQDSGSNKIKIIGIIAGVISLIIIIVVLVWFFVLNKQQEQPTSTTQPEVVDLPSPQTQTQGPGFGAIPDATEQAQPQATDQPAPETSTAPDTSQTTIPPVQ